MTTIVTRAGKGSPLTHTEVDTNFTNLNTAKLETAAIPLGTAAAPSISFLSDSNTGIYSPGADQLAVATNGTSRLSIDASGNVAVDTNTLYVDAANNQVGVGTTSPGSPLTIESSAGNQVKITYPSVASYFLNATSGGDLAINKDGSEKARIDSSGRLLVGTVTGNANGGILQLSSGITFPATAVAASDANTLDDYEEGTWTPSLGGTATYNYQQGNYTKIGRFVYIRGALSVATLGTGSTANITALPFSVGSITGRFGGNVYYFDTMAVNVLNLTVFLNGSTVSFSNISTAGTQTTDGPAIFGNGASVQFSVCYQV